MKNLVLLLILGLVPTSCSVEHKEPAAAQQSPQGLRAMRGWFTLLTENAARNSYRLRNWLSLLGQRHAYEIRGDTWFTSSLNGNFARSRSGRVRGKTYSTFGEFMASSDLGSKIKYDVNQDGFFGYHTPDRLVLGIFDGSSTGGSGELATQVGIDTMRRHLPEHSLPQALNEVRDELYVYASIHPHVSRQYSAVAAGVEITGNTARIAHAGDVRVLHLRDDSLLFHTDDHNPAWREVMEGRLSAQKYLSPQVDKSGADRELRIPRGSDNGREMVETAQRQLKSGDTMVLASDGVWKVCTIAEIVALTRGRSTADAAEAIRRRVRLRVGGDEKVDDNVTVIVYRHDPARLLQTL